MNTTIKNAIKKSSTLLRTEAPARSIARDSTKVAIIPIRIHITTNITNITDTVVFVEEDSFNGLTNETQTTGVAKVGEATKTTTITPEIRTAQDLDHPAEQIR